MVKVKRKDETIEIENLDDFFRVVKEVRREEEPLILVIDGVEEIVAPTPRRRRRTPAERRKADDEAFMASFGAWKGLIDRDEFMRRVREGRSSQRPVVKFTSPEE